MSKQYSIFAIFKSYSISELPNSNLYNPDSISGCHPSCPIRNWGLNNTLVGHQVRWFFSAAKGRGGRLFVGWKHRGIEVNLCATAKLCSFAQHISWIIILNKGDGIYIFFNKFNRKPIKFLWDLTSDRMIICPSLTGTCHLMTQVILYSH